MMITIALRAPNGQSRIQIEDESTLTDLISLIKTKTELDKFTLKYGYPLQNLDITPAAQGATIKDLKLQGETIVIAPTESNTPPPPPPPASAPESFKPKPMEPDETSLEWPERGGYIGMIGFLSTFSHFSRVLLSRSISRPFFLVYSYIYK